jgi:hypothetical protein
MTIEEYYGYKIFELDNPDCNCGDCGCNQGGGGSPGH